MKRDWAEAVLTCSLDEEQDNESSVGPREKERSSSSWITGGPEDGGTSVKSSKLSRCRKQNVERGGKKMAILIMGT